MEPPQIDLQPHEVRPKGSPRMSSGREVNFLIWMMLIGLIVILWLMLTRDEWWVPFLAWPPVFVLGAAVGYRAPQTFFSKDS